MVVSVAATAAAAVAAAAARSKLQILHYVGSAQIELVGSLRFGSPHQHIHCCFGKPTNP